ncbi:MAG: hypothetical protein NC411_05035 [Bacteroides sp.]|nr:hypothetical protein [Bacteroides sp.]
MKLLIPVILTVVLLSCGSCSNGREEAGAVPKPEAWPRIEVPAEVYVADTVGDVELRLNAVARSMIRSNGGEGVWIDVTYPGFGDARLYLTVLSVNSDARLDEVVANRRERMELNSGGAVTELTELTSDGGWSGELAVTRSSLTTPVQMLAYDGRHIVTGVFYLNLPVGASADSVAPIVGAVSRDLVHTLKHLRTL